MNELKQNRDIIVLAVMAIMTAFVLSLATAGCAGSCIKVAGGYKDATGEVEYCFDKDKSKNAQTPVLSDSEGQTFFGITEDELKKIIEKIKGKTAEVKTAEVLVIPEIPILQLKKILQEGDKK